MNTKIKDRVLLLLAKNNYPVEHRDLVASLAATSNPKPPISFKGKVSFFKSRKVGEAMVTKSNLEEAIADLFECDGEVEIWVSQVGPIELEINSGGVVSKRKHYPDILVIKKTGVSLHLIKYESELNKICGLVEGVARDEHEAQLWSKDDSGTWISPPLIMWAAKFGMSVVVTTDKGIKRRVENWRYLEPYTRNPVPVDPVVLTRLKGAVAKEEGIVLGRMHGELGFTADDINRAIAQREIWVNLDKATLSDRLHTRAFTNEQSYQRFCAIDKVVGFDAIYPVEHMKLTAGQVVQYDGVELKIVLPGLTSIIAEVVSRSRAGEQITLSRDQFMSEVKAGRIRVFESADSRIRKCLELGTKAYDAGMTKAAALGLRDIGKDFPELVRSVPFSPATLARARRKILAAGEGANPIVVLAPDFRARGNREARFPASMLARIRDLIFVHHAKQPAPKVTESYRNIKMALQEDGNKGVVYVDPRITGDGVVHNYISEKSYRDIIKNLGQKDRMQLKALRDGRASAVALKGPFNGGTVFATHGVRPGDDVDFDHSKASVICKGFVPESYLDDIWYSVMRDQATGKVLLVVVSYSPPSWRIVAFALRLFVATYGFLPLKLHLDNATEFRCKALKRFYQHYGGKLKWRRVLHPKDAPEIERTIGTISAELIEELPGSTRAYAKDLFYTKDIDPKSHATLSLELVQILLQFLVEERVNKVPAPTQSMSPNDLWSAALQTHGRHGGIEAAYDDDLKFLTMTPVATKGGRAKVQEGKGVQINGFLYWADEFKLGKNIGKPVGVLVDTFRRGLGKAEVYTTRGVRDWVDMKCEQLTKVDFLSDLEAHCAFDALQRSIVIRAKKYQVARDALVGFYAKIKTLPPSFADFEKIISDARVRAHLLGKTDPAFAWTEDSAVSASSPPCPAGDPRATLSRPAEVRTSSSAVGENDEYENVETDEK